MRRWMSKVATPSVARARTSIPPGLTHQLISDGNDTYSDSRIKNIHGVSDASKDLQILQGIQVTDYTHKDAALGRRVLKKVIAQQVEEVYPRAVKRMRRSIPDIMKKASIDRDGWVQMTTDLQVGERIEFLINDSRDSHEVLETRNGAFRTNFEPFSRARTRLFVYGREVDDFRIVDYDAIAMLNVSATQELHRRLEAKEKLIDESTDAA